MAWEANGHLALHRPDQQTAEMLGAGTEQLGPDQHFAGAIGVEPEQATIAAHHPAAALVLEACFTGAEPLPLLVG